MVEYRKFFADALCHHPEMRLEYVAADSSVDRLVRRRATQPKKKKDIKGKGKAAPPPPPPPPPPHTTYDMNSDFSATFVEVHAAGGLNSNGLPAEFQDSSDEDENSSMLTSGLKIEAVEGLRFCDIPGVKMFAKEITQGRL